MLDAQHMQRVAQQLKASEKARHSASKYDFVKVLTQFCALKQYSTGGMSYHKASSSSVRLAT